MDHFRATLKLQFESISERMNLFNVPLRPQITNPKHKLSPDDIRRLKRYSYSFSRFYPIGVIDFNPASNEGLSKVLDYLIETTAPLNYQFVAVVDCNIYTRLIKVSIFNLNYLTFTHFV